MSAPRIVVTHRIHAEVVELLSAAGDVVMNPAREHWPELARDADALMVFMPDSLDEAFLAECRNLKIVAAALKGYDNFDVEACTRRGIWFTIAPDLLSEPTAELALALMLGLARHVAAGDELIRGGEYRGWRPTLYGQGLRGSTIGLIGYGRLGRALARMLTGFDCQVLFHDPAAGDKATGLDELLAASDFVLPLLPLTPGTFHLLHAGTLARMKPGAYLINVGRGSVVDEEAVADALDSGHVAGYAADVFEMEDWARADRPSGISERLLRTKEKTLFTPHLGSAVGRVRLEIEREAAKNIVQALRGERPADAINHPAISNT